nr:hypothetical protein BT69DRAFT_1296171 [Atractiella rhizophila]
MELWAASQTDWGRDWLKTMDGLGFPYRKTGWGGTLKELSSSSFGDTGIHKAAAALGIGTSAFDRLKAPGSSSSPSESKINLAGESRSCKLIANGSYTKQVCAEASFETRENQFEYTWRSLEKWANQFIKSKRYTKENVKTYILKYQEILDSLLENDQITKEEAHHFFWDSLPKSIQEVTSERRQREEEMKRIKEETMKMIGGTEREVKIKRKRRNVPTVDKVWEYIKMIMEEEEDGEYGRNNAFQALQDQISSLSQTVGSLQCQLQETAGLGGNGGGWSQNQGAWNNNWNSGGWNNSGRGGYGNNNWRGRGGGYGAGRNNGPQTNQNQQDIPMTGTNTIPLPVKPETTTANTAVIAEVAAPKDAQLTLSVSNVHLSWSPPALGTQFETAVIISDQKEETQVAV